MAAKRSSLRSWLVRDLASAVLYAVLALSVGVACRPAPETPTVPAATTVTSTSPTPTLTAIPTPPGTQVASGTLNLTDVGPITLDPGVVGEATSGAYILQLFSGLVRLDDQLKVASDIAERWEINGDGKKYRFFLRPNVRFHDGTPVKAADFKYSWERALDPATGSNSARTYLGDIIGAADVLAGTTRDLAGARVIDDLTLEVTIDGPKAYFLAKMSYPTSFVVQKANVETGRDWWQRPVGTGPFKLKEFQKDQLVVLARNADYYGEKARINEVVYKLLAGSPMMLYQNGSIDVAFTGGSFIGLLTDPSNPLSRELHIFPELSFSYIGFNSSKPPFDDPNVRRAFTYALDKEKITRLSVLDTVTTAYSILPPGFPGHDSSLQGLRFDPAKAREALAMSRYGDASRLPPITFTTSGFGGNISGVLGGAIEEWRRNLGVDVKVRQLEPEAFLYTLRREKDELYELAWIADYTDPQDFLDILFRTGSENNAGDYSNAAVDALLDRAAVEQDPVARLAMYQQVERMLVEDAATLPLFFGRSYVLVKPYVKDFFVSPLGHPLLTKVSLGLRSPTGGRAQ